MQVVVLGTGNVAYALGRAAQAAGHQVVQVYGRHLAAAAPLAAELHCTATDQLTQLYTNASIYLLAVSDNAIPLLAANLPQVEGIVAHTAGAVPVQVLEVATTRYGVLYPLQSLRKEKQDYASIPLLVDGSDAGTKSILVGFAQSISKLVAEADDAYRLKLHTAAVVASNFTNHLYALTEAFCQNEAVNFQLLSPLIEETAFRLRQFHPANVQTGPAIRGDEATIYRHLQVLNNHPQLQYLYQILTQSIQTMNHER
jgi:predicted short-subunit dehydrogenase-like oxidoreductase (DUF2520 family)